MQRILILLLLVNNYAVISQTNSINLSIDTLKEGEKMAQIDIDNDIIRFIPFGFSEVSVTSDSLLKANNIHLDQNRGCNFGNDGVVLSDYNSYMRKYINEIYGSNFLDSLYALAKEIDKAGMGNRFPHPLGIETSIKEYLWQKFIEKQIDSSLFNSEINFSFTIGLDGKAFDFKLIKGNSFLYDFVINEMLNLFWLSAT